MRIALVLPYSLDVAGGVGTHVMGLARWLAAQGHEPRVIAPGTKPVEADFPVHLVGPGIGFRFNGSIARLAVRPGQSRRALALVEGADVIHVHEPLTPGIAHAVASAHDVVVTHHARYTVPTAVAGLLRRRSAGIRALRRMAVSRGAAETAALVTGHEPELVPNAVESVPVTAKPATPVVAFLGRRDDPRKGHDVFRSMADRMRGQAEFVELVDGTAPPEQVQRMFARATVLVAPNLGGESFGMVLVEALAHGCGIVASDLPEFRAVVDDPRVTTWFTPGDVEGGVEALRRRLALGSDSEVARRLAQAYSWDSVGPRIVARYGAGPLG